MTSIADGYPVTLYDDAEANGIAHEVGDQLGQNLEQFRSRIKVARRMSRPVAVVGIDAGGTCTVVFGRDGAVVHNDVVGRPSVTVRAADPAVADLADTVPDPVPIDGYRSM